ncbi:MAG: outer membrane protein assembly factor [Acidobacteriota bacterium]
MIAPRRSPAALLDPARRRSRLSPGRRNRTPSRVANTVLLLVMFAGPKVAAQELPSPDQVARLLGRTVAAVHFVPDGPVPGLDPEELRSLTPLREGMVLDLAACRFAVEQMVETGLFRDVRISAEPAGTAGGVVLRVYLYRRVTVGAVHFVGDLKVSRQELRREVPVRRGALFAREQADEGTRRLRDFYRRLGYFDAEVGIATEFNEAGATVEIRYRITPGARRRLGQVTVRFEGAAVDGELERKIRDTLDLSPGDPYDERRFEAATARCLSRLRREGFPYAAASWETRERQGAARQVDVEFTVRPGEPLEVEIVGWEVPADRMARLPLFVQPPSNGRLPLEETVRLLRRWLAEDGYYLAEVVYTEEGPQAGVRRVRFEVRPGRRYSFGAIRFEGNQTFAADVLRRLVQSRPEGLWTHALLSAETAERDAERIRDFYQEKGFLDARVTWRLVEEERELALVFVIDEGPAYRIRRLQFTGLQEFPAERLRAQVQQREGSTFSPVLLAADRTALQAELQNQGFRSAAVRPVVERIEGGAVDVRFEIEEGPKLETGRIVIAGTRDTADSVLRREIELRSGEPLSFGALLRSEANLYDLGVFSRVRWRELPAFERPRVRHIFYELEEAQRYSLTYGLGYSHTFGSSASEGLRGAFSITDSNFRGRANSLSLGVRAGSRRQRGTLTYDVRRILGRRIPTTFRLVVDNENRISLDEARRLRVRGRPYDALRIAFSSQVERRMSRRESLFLRYGFERIELSLPQDVTIPPEFFREDRNLLLSKLGADYLNESRDVPLDPHSGFFLAGEATLAAKAIGSQRQFFRFFAQGRYYFPLNERVTLVSALRIGVIQSFGAAPPDGADPVPISEKFFAGGPGTLRGLPPDLAGPLLTDPETGELVLVGDPGDETPIPLGGNGLLVANLELRFPIVGFLHGAAFYDVGNVFESIRAMGRERLSNAYGFGLALRTPVGPIRLDLAYNPSPPQLEGFRTWNIHFNLGHPF